VTFKRTKRLRPPARSRASSSTAFGVLWRTRRRPHRPALFGRRPSRFFTSSTRSPPGCLLIRAGSARRAGQAFAPELRLHAVPEEDSARKKRQPINPQRIVCQKTRRSSTFGSSTLRPARRRKVGHATGPPIRYSYRASRSRPPARAFDSLAGQPIRLSARANCSVAGHQSMPIRSRSA